jgi:hypothetical protein
MRQSSEHLSNISQAFGYDTVDEFKLKFSEIENSYNAGEFKEYRFSNAFESAPLICTYLKSKDLGIHK